jgi:hypothetical protein
LPLPVSPWIKTLASAREIFSMRLVSAFISAEPPIIIGAVPDA